MQEIQMDGVNLDQGPSSSSGIHPANAALTNMRETISPYLPPPALKWIKSIDTNPQIKQYVNNDEPSMTIVVALVSIYVLTALIRLISFRGNHTRAVEGLDDDKPEGNVLSNLNVRHAHEQPYQDSVLLFGPCNAGKSLLFHRLTSHHQGTSVEEEEEEDVAGIHTHTVMSLKANVNVADGVRIVDYPGHITLSKSLDTLLLPQHCCHKILFVVDSTKSLSEAAGILYRSVLTNASVTKAWKKAGEVMRIMVVCNKSDETGAKHWRRIKIQLRGELEKLKKVSSTLEKRHGGEGGLDMGGDGHSDKETLELTGKTIDLDDLSKNGLEMVTLNFLSLSAKNGDGMKELEAFVKNGEVLTDNSSILKARRR